MKFTEKLPKKEDLLKSPELFAKLICEKYCGDIFTLSLEDHDITFLSKILETLSKEKINYRQFNEILLLLNQDTISEGYFEFFFEDKTANIDDILKGIVSLRGFCMLKFGNFRYPYKEFRQYPKEELDNIFTTCQKKATEELETNYYSRPDKMLEIDKIEKDKTWYLGYIASQLITTEANTYRDEHKIEEDIEKLSEDERNFYLTLSELDDIILNTQKKGFLNTEKYLTWDYLDIYVATSMRSSWEFEEAYDFIEDVFSEKKLEPYKLRYFDPTQSFSSNLRDKGLVEGLMLKRAICTIYLAQESDTMGKDSELATTLAQEKPVIVYVPKPNAEDYAKKIFSYPLSYFKKRFLALHSIDMFDNKSILESLSKYTSNPIEKIENYLEAYEKYRETQPYRLNIKKDNEFKEKYSDFQLVCRLLSEVECIHYEKRAEILKGRHPLSMQVVIDTGVANGVLVVRTAEECSLLLEKIITFDMEFNIITEYSENILGQTDGITVLKERISGSAYRVVTHQERLSNSFWNNFWEKDKDDE